MLDEAEAINADMSGGSARGRAPGAIALSIALIGLEKIKRSALTAVLAGLEYGAVAEIPVYPELDEVPKFLEQRYDVILIDLDANGEYALDLVESLCGQSSATVMVYSGESDPTWMVRCMRAGAREFLAPPFTAEVLAEALIRASARQPRSRAPNPSAGAVSVFFGTKGGSGVTTLATNFALLLARESARKTLLIDLDLPLGDAALALGVKTTYSTADALENFARLDATFLSKLLVQHSPDFFVLAAPSTITRTEVSSAAIRKLLTVARKQFEFVVVDAGARLNARAMSIFEMDAQFYLLSQVGIPDLRNANRIIAEFFPASRSKLEVVLNRYSPSALGVDEGQIAKALTRPPQWKIPEDCVSTRKAQNAGTPLGLTDSPVAAVIKQMARTFAGVPATSQKKNWLSAMMGR